MWKQSKLRWLDSCHSNQELTERYDQFARDYERTFIKEFEYKGSQLAAEFFVRYVPKEARVLDAGAGTGLTGVTLAKLGYHDLVALDISQAMLEEARKKNVYRELYQMVMGESLNFANNSFDALLGVGVFGAGHAPASSFSELARIASPTGYIVFTLRSDVYESYGFKEKQESLEAAGKWKLVEVSDKLQLLPKVEPDVYHQVWVYQVTS